MLRQDDCTDGKSMARTLREFSSVRGNVVAGPDSRVHSHSTHDKRSSVSMVTRTHPRKEVSLRGSDPQ